MRDSWEVARAVAGRKAPGRRRRCVGYTKVGLTLGHELPDLHGSVSEEVTCAIQARNVAPSHKSNYLIKLPNKRPLRFASTVPTLLPAEMSQFEVFFLLDIRGENSCPISDKLVALPPLQVHRADSGRFRAQSPGEFGPQFPKRAGAPCASPSAARASVRFSHAAMAGGFEGGTRCPWGSCSPRRHRVEVHRGSGLRGSTAGEQQHSSRGRRRAI